MSEEGQRPIPGPASPSNPKRTFQGCPLGSGRSSQFLWRISSRMVSQALNGCILLRRSFVSSHSDLKRMTASTADTLLAQGLSDESTCISFRWQVVSALEDDDISLENRFHCEALLYRMRPVAVVGSFEHTTASL